MRRTAAVIAMLSAAALTAHTQSGALSGQAVVGKRPIKGAVIGGRVLDADGDPVIGAPIFIESLKILNGRPTTAGEWIGQINDLGEYRVGGLPAGDYVASVTAPPAMEVFRLPGNQVGARPAGRPGRIYFPGVSSLSDAQTISLSAGEERTSINFVGPSPTQSTADLIQGALAGLAAPNATTPATGEIRGQILARSGGALAGAQVQLIGDASRYLPPVRTDTLGRYGFTGLPAGTYRLRARKISYITLEFGQREPQSRREPIVLAANEHRDRTDITLPRTSVIAGRVVDEYGDPVEGVSVRALQIHFVAGRRRLSEVPNGSASRTDDLGRYRVSGLLPGQYVIAAFVGQLVLQQSGIADIPGYATTYFPGTTNPPEVRLVSVGLQDTAAGIDVPLARTPTATISGRQLNAAGQGVSGGLTLISSQRSGSVSTVGVGARTEPDGTFTFRNVPPGQYVIQYYRGRNNPNDEGEFAAVSVIVNGRDVKDLVVRATPGSTIAGRITFDTTRPPNAGDIEISAVPADVDLAPDGQLARANIHDDWTFAFSGINGPRRLRLLHAPAGWGLRGIYVSGIDVTDRPLSFGTERESLRDVEVRLTDRVAEIAGTVKDAQGRAAAGALVIVYSSNRDRWYDRSRYLVTTMSNGDGVFSVADFAPGEYFVAAVDPAYAQSGEWQNPELLQALMPRAVRVVLAEGMKQSVSPTLVAPLTRGR